MSRGRKEPEIVAEALRRVKLGASPEVVSAEMREAGMPIGVMTIRRALAAPPPAAAPARPPPQKLVPVPRRPPPPAPSQPPAIEPAPVALAAPDVAEGTPAERLRAYAAHDPQAAQLLEDLLAPPPAMSADSLATTHGVLAELLRDFKRATTAREKGVLADKIGAQVKTVERILRSRPKPVPPDAVLAELARLDAEAIALIEQHLPEPITAAELAA